MALTKKVEKLTQRMERMDILEKKLEEKNEEAENLQKRMKEGELQLESRVEELKKNQNQEIKSLKKQVTEIECKMGEDL